MNLVGPDLKGRWSRLICLCSIEKWSKCFFVAELSKCFFLTLLANFELRIDQAKWSVLLRPFFALLTTDDSCFFVTEDRSVSFFLLREPACGRATHRGGSPPAGHGAVHRGGRVLWRVTNQVLNFCSFSRSDKTQGLFFFFALQSWMVQPSSTAHGTRIRGSKRHETNTTSSRFKIASRVLW